MTEVKVTLEKVGMGKRGAWYAVTFQGKVLCVSRDPEFQACRELAALGFRGALTTYWKGSSTPAMILDIQRDAAKRTKETPDGELRTVKWEPYRDEA